MPKRQVNKENAALRKQQHARFFTEFSKYHREWMKELVARYMERGEFPFFPTFITGYYDNADDKVVAALSTLCMDWSRDDVMQQMTYMRELMGERPYEWVMSRAFVTLSFGDRQNKLVNGKSGLSYWRIARFFSELYDFCDGGKKTLRKCFPSGKANAYGTRMGFFAEKVANSCGLKHTLFKAGVVELVLRTSDGIGDGVWATDPQKVKTPVSSDLTAFMKVWFPDYNNRNWSFSEAVALFGLEREYDFFYAWLAWEDLKKWNREECVRYSTVYLQRYKKGQLKIKTWWVGKYGFMPEIRFDAE